MGTDTLTAMSLSESENGIFQLIRIHPVNAINTFAVSVSTSKIFPRRPIDNGGSNPQDIVKKKLLTSTIIVPWKQGSILASSTGPFIAFKYHKLAILKAGDTFNI